MAPLARVGGGGGEEKAQPRQKRPKRITVCVFRLFHHLPASLQFFKTNKKMRPCYSVYYFLLKQSCVREEKKTEGKKVEIEITTFLEGNLARLRSRYVL